MLKKIQADKRNHSPLTVEEIPNRNNTVEKLYYTADFQRLKLYGNVITFIYQLTFSYTENICCCISSRLLEIGYISLPVSLPMLYVPFPSRLVNQFSSGLFFSHFLKFEMKHWF